MKTIKMMNILRNATFALMLVAIGACSEGGTSSGVGGSTSTPGGTGIAGSTARMVIVDNFLYAIAGDEIELFLIDIPSMPNQWDNVTVDLDIQTLFPYKDPLGNNYLLVGAADGMYILDNSDTSNPRVVGDLTHARTIDPVVATGGYAYVTLKNDPLAFNQVEDQMNVVDLADVTNPQLVNVIGMQSPEGLSTVDNRLFVCDGPAGVKQYNLDDPVNPLFVDVIRNVNCNDVITINGILYAITDTSLQQYDYSVSPPALLSIIETESMSADALSRALNGKVQI